MFVNKFRNNFASWEANFVSVTTVPKGRKREAFSSAALLPRLKLGLKLSSFARPLHLPHLQEIGNKLFDLKSHFVLDNV